MSSIVQALVFAKEFFTKKRAEQWAKQHGFNAIKQTHETPFTYRIRIRQPNDKYEYRTKALSTGIKAVLGFLPYALYE